MSDFKNDLLDEELLKRRIEERKNRQGERRVLCLECRKRISETKRCMVKFCSIKCKTKHNWSKVQELVVEIRHTIRTLKVVEECRECAEKLNTKIRPGPVPTLCNKCRWRITKRKYRESKKCQ